MRTVALNGSLTVWVSLLLFAPGIAIATFRRLSALLLAGSAALTLSALCLVTYIVADAGDGARGPLRVCAALLALTLIGAVGRAAVLTRRRRWKGLGGPGWHAAPLGVVLGIWMLTPPLLELGRLGSSYGLATIFNADIADYVMASDNVARSGFQDSHHIANGNLGAYSHHSYMGAETLLVFASAATGLAVWQVALASLAVAVCIASIGLWALAEAIWPGLPFGLAASVTTVATLASLSSYLIAQYFLGGALGGASVVIALAGATALARGPNLGGSLALAAGTSLGIYSYGHIGLPVTLLLPLWTVLAAALVGKRALRELVRAALRSITSAVAGFLIAYLAVATAIHLIKQQSQILAGWPMPALEPLSLLVWPAGIAPAGNGHPVSDFRLGASWSLVALIAIGLMVLAWRKGEHGPVLLASVLTAGCVLVIAYTVKHYGADRYQSWKMESLLLPTMLVCVLPALGSVQVRSRSVGRAILAAGVGLVVLGPTMTWQPVDNQPTVSTITSSAMTELARSPALNRLSSVNVRLSPFFETMAVADLLRTKVVIMSSPTYQPAATSLDTCTLTRRDMLLPGQTNFTDLGDGYVLLQEPTTCAVAR